MDWTKNNLDGSINKHKASLEVKAHVQQVDVEYRKTFCPSFKNWNY